MGSLVSVVIPLYNHSAYIEKCLNSVLDQDVSNIELILLDDGSSDNGFEFAKKWEELHRGKFVRTHFERQSNVGITRTMDRLIRLAEGDFILGLASDDILLPNSICALLSAFKNDKICAVFGDAMPIDGEGKVIGQSAIGELGVPSAREALSDSRTLLWELIFRWNVYGSVLMTRRKFMMTNQGSSILNTELFSEDMQLYYRIAGQGALSYLDKPVAGYRIHGENISRTAENISKLRHNIFMSRLHSLPHLKFAPRVIVRLQAFTYNRWCSEGKRFVLMPLVVVSYACLLLARIYYDLFRLVILGHKDRPMAKNIKSIGRR